MQELTDHIISELLAFKSEQLNNTSKARLNQTNNQMNNKLNHQMNQIRYEEEQIARFH